MPPAAAPQPWLQHSTPPTDSSVPRVCRAQATTTSGVISESTLTAALASVNVTKPSSAGPEAQKIRQRGRGVDLDQQIDIALGRGSPRASEPNRLKRVMPRAQLRRLLAQDAAPARARRASDRGLGRRWARRDPCCYRRPMSSSNAPSAAHHIRHRSGFRSRVVTAA
jgi:hypothetical protein